MKVLLTGSTGYIGRRLLPVLVNSGHQVICLVRDKRRFDWNDFDKEFLENIEVVEADLENASSLEALSKDIDAAYYLVHSLSSGYSGFSETEKITARNFSDWIRDTSAQQIIYVGGIANDEQLSEHLQSRYDVEEVLTSSGVPLTVLRAAIIIGSGSASFEIIRDLVEKLPVMIAPKWLNSRCQPIAIRNVIQYLDEVLLNKLTYHKVFDIGGPDILTYKQILTEYAKKRKLNRSILSVPVLTPKLSSLWLYFVTTTSYPLARNLVESMRHDVIVNHQGLDEIIPVKKYTYQEALDMAFSKISQKNIISSWKDAVSNKNMKHNFLDFVDVPKFGCLSDKRIVTFSSEELNRVKENIWCIGGFRGWYFGNWLWRMRGLMDKAVGGVGLRRGRRSPTELKNGDSLDFWRVILADQKRHRLLLYAEMKLPGEAWLEFKILEGKGSSTLVQTATFRPLGLWGRIYWYILLPFHAIIFPKMAHAIVNHKT
jgi:uncharacterized protein YbjT (DUF2867 family)